MLFISSENFLSVGFEVDFFDIMADSTPKPKSYHARMVPLGEAHFPFGENCKLDREVQAAAYHHELSAKNVSALIGLELCTVLSFSTTNPDGDHDQRGTFRLVNAVFESPVGRWVKDVRQF